MRLEQHIASVEDGNPSSDVVSYEPVSEEEAAQALDVPAIEDIPENLEQSMRAHLSEISGPASMEECIYAPSESIVVMNMMPGQDTSYDEEFKFDSPKSGGVTFSTQNYENKRVLAKVQQQDEAAYALITTPIRAELDALTKLVKSQAGMARRRSERRIWVLRGVLGHDLNMALLQRIALKYERIDAVPTSYH